MQRITKKRFEEADILKTLDVLLGPTTLFKTGGYTFFARQKCLKHSRVYNNEKEDKRKYKK